MTKLKVSAIAAIVMFSAHALGTPILVVGTRDGFVIGTNGLDSGHIEVCKIHYAGSTVILRSATDVRWPATRDPDKIVYDSSLEEWKVLSSKKSLAQISADVKLDFVKSAKHIANLEVTSRRGKSIAQILDSMKEHIVIVGFESGSPRLKAWRLTFTNGEPRYQTVIDSRFDGKQLTWFSDDSPPNVTTVQPMSVDQIKATFDRDLPLIANMQRNPAFDPPWEIVHLTRKDSMWLEGREELCEKDRKKWSTQ
jgi:hypothetical protein